ncbi:OOP family OmpA-OmpF porin [Mucilaginibacter frigoritolerans]|uniref:OOP family OmpA-OmpF porin n=1 Tax=Mucilaginibacter frigoritolerans TaxID=652788 RepID=A0A562U4B8_9SPHI|nr:OmpA family protein [Mucilaginibacter frigoritolerans]TWI99960.1 OOP family OmpA-OmpF porin [Mucilaginibacter frigoritolerans]
MNYSTLKKTVVFSFVSLMAVGFASAQTDTAKSLKKVKTSDSTSTPKLFGGAGQYNTWSVGVNVGVTAPSVATGGVTPFTHNKAELGYGLSVRDQLSHAFGLQADFHGGKLAGNDNGGTSTDSGNGLPYSSFSTNFYSGSLTGVVDVGSVSFLHRKNSVNFYVLGGAGLMWYKPTAVDPSGNSFPYSHYAKELFIPVGAGVKFKLTEQLSLNLGYTENFMDGFNLEAIHTKYPAENKYSYGYAGLEYTFGPKSKPSLEWVNPIAQMYDELYDAALRQEVEALKGRVANVETAVSDLKKDSDGDGVSDQFDKCPNTPAGTVVDGSGCPIVFPKPDTIKAATAAVAPYSNIQFEFDSSVLKTSSYPVLDATSADLRSNSSVVTLAGYASSEGTASHNLRLSKDRANSVKTYLVNSGVDAKRVKVKGYGETHPIADNSTEDGRILNRRVEFHK